MVSFALRQRPRDTKITDFDLISFWVDQNIFRLYVSMDDIGSVNLSKGAEDIVGYLS